MGLKSCLLTALAQKSGKVVKFLNRVIHRSSHGDRRIFYYWSASFYRATSASREL